MNCTAHTCLLAAALLLTGCANDLEEVQKLAGEEQLPHQTALNGTINYTDSARIEFTVVAGRIDRYGGNEPRDEFNDGVTITSFDRRGNFESRIIAKQAVNYPELKQMTATDSVSMENAEGKKLSTEALTWDEKSGTVYTDAFVTITTKTEVLFGEGLDAKDDFSEYEIRNIKGRIKLEQPQ